MASDPRAATVTRLIALLSEKRHAQGLSQETLAKMANLSRTGIRHIENGDVQPTLYSLLKIADALGVELASLIRKAHKSARAEQSLLTDCDQKQS